MQTSPPQAEQAAWELSAVDVVVRRGGRVVLNGVSVSIRAGETVSLIGPNGSGKTTLLLALLGLLPAASGTIRLNGVELSELSPRARGRFAAYVPQTVEALPPFRVRDVVAGGRYPHLSPLRPLSHTDEEIVTAALSRCGLTHLADQPANAISGGERQKALIAAALAQDPRALFLDEPTSALDPAVQVELLALLRGWSGTARALLVVSHDLDVPAALGGRVLALRDGQVLRDEPAESALTPEALEDVYGSPFETARTQGGRRLVAPALRFSPASRHEA